MKSNSKSPGMTRRDFARGAVLAGTAAVIAPLAGGETSPASQSKPEAEAMYHAILRKHGELNDVQKKELRAQIDGALDGIEKLRAFPLENWDEPATVLHLPANSPQGGQ